MKVLITGSNGQLGSEIKELASEYENLECIFKDLPELDICDTEVLNTFIIDQHINAVINCAGYTAVDRAEEEALISQKVNSEGVLNSEKNGSFASFSETNTSLSLTPHWMFSVGSSQRIPTSYIGA